ncbi:MAG: FHA domain-containing protein, partial [Nesterenkonia sp.]|nr:FHA domain-containing protein [Nesterenkonia sp.]
GISIADSGISRRHMEIYRQGERYFARDLGSTNGTYVDGERLDPEAPGTELFDSALISLGGARLRFRMVTEG